ncbi:MAG TPA: hypothetical protein ENK19_05475, partial [Acidobacteria bacterium]|nr:hypothetical protein [Acidobacteriota bacterium]
MILLLFSLGSWSVILAKWRELGTARRASDAFLKSFRKATRLNEVVDIASKHRKSPLATLFQAGYAELGAQIRVAQRRGAAEEGHRIRSLEGVQRALQRAAGAERERLGRALPFLAPTASVTPFIGLFGTVWGIMNTFRAIGATGS